MFKSIYGENERIPSRLSGLRSKMTLVCDEARMLVSLIAKETQDMDFLTGLSWLVPNKTTELQHDSTDDWALKEVRWAQHTDVFNKLVHLTNYWASLEQNPVVSSMTRAQPKPLFTSSPGDAFSESAHGLPYITALTSTIPTPTVCRNCSGLANSSLHPHLSFVDVLCSLSGQLELFYTVNRVYLQSLRYYCFYTFSPDLRQSVLHAVDKAYEKLVLGVMKCFRVTHCLKVAHTTHPDTFQAMCVSQLPSVFTLTDDNSEESPMNNHFLSKQENEKCLKKEGMCVKRPRDDALDKESESCRVDEEHILRSRKRRRSTLEHETSKMRKSLLSCGEVGCHQHP